MSVVRRALLPIALMVPSVLLPGCGAKPSAPDETVQRMNELRQVDALYWLYVKQHEGALPKQLADLTQKDNEMGQPLAVRVLKEGLVLVVLGISDRDSGAVLAYEKDAPQAGGFVLLADGKIQKLSADEVKARVK